MERWEERSCEILYGEGLYNALPVLSPRVQAAIPEREWAQTYLVVL